MTFDKLKALLNSPSIAEVTSPSRPQLPPLRRAFFFEVEVLEVQLGKTQTLSLGFAWKPPDAAHLPENIVDFPRAISVGSEPPRSRVSGLDEGEVPGWRPAIHVMTGAVLCAFLEIRAHNGSSVPALLRLLVFQDGVLRTDIRRELPASASECCWPRRHTSSSEPRLTSSMVLSRHRPFGIVDVAGGVRSVQLRATQVPQIEAEDGLPRRAILSVNTL